MPQNYQKDPTVGNIVPSAHVSQYIIDRNIQHLKNNPNHSPQHNIAEFVYSAFNYLNHYSGRLREVPQRNPKEAHQCRLGLEAFRTASAHDAATSRKIHRVSTNTLFSLKISKAEICTKLNEYTSSVPQKKSY